MRSIKRILIHRTTGKKFYVKDLDDAFHTEFGVISQTELQSAKSVVASTKQEEFTMLAPTFADLWENLQRGPQVMIQKDIGLIIAKTGINQHSKVVDAGGGSGSLCLSLANICREITVYEINPEHFDIIQKNVRLFGVNNLKLKQADISKGLSEQELDLITLDLPEPWLLTKYAEQALHVGGWLVVYLPNLLQVKQFLTSLRGTAIKEIETVELLERKWKIADKIMRPEFQMLGHTGFLVFCRKL